MRKQAVFPLLSLAFALMTSALMANPVGSDGEILWQESFFGGVTVGTGIFMPVNNNREPGPCTKGYAVTLVRPHVGVRGGGNNSHKKLYISEVDYGLCPTLEMRDHETYESYEVPVYHAGLTGMSDKEHLVGMVPVILDNPTVGKAFGHKEFRLYIKAGAHSGYLSVRTFGPNSVWSRDHEIIMYDLVQDVRF